MNQVIPEEFIESTRVQTGAIIEDVKKRSEPLTTEQIALIVFEQKNLTHTEHVQVLSVMVAILLQRAAYE